MNNDSIRFRRIGKRGLLVLTFNSEARKLLEMCAWVKRIGSILFIDRLNVNRASEFLSKAGFHSGFEKT